jgi:hypothetical protein
VVLALGSEAAWWQWREIDGIHDMEIRGMAAKRRSVKVAFVGGGSMSWAPRLIRDIIFKDGMEQADLEFVSSI